jgi:hypothetical protein
MPTGATSVPADRQVLERLAAELAVALRGMGWQEWGAIGSGAAEAAARDVVNHKKRLYEDGKEFLDRTVQRYRSLGFEKAAKGDITAAGEWLGGVPGRLQAGMDRFRALSGERQAEEVAAWVLTLGLAYAIAGGQDVEGGLPDTDIAVLGIGAHRSVLSHSVLLGLGAEFAMRFSAEALLRMHPRLPAGHHEFWDRSADFLQRNRGLAVGAIWAGIGMHLLKDASVFAPATKPVVGLPFPAPMGIHQAFLAANGVVASVVGVHAATDRGMDGTT